MVCFDNLFALLGDEDDGAGVVALVERMVAVRMAAVRAAKKQQEKKVAAAKPKAVAKLKAAAEDGTPHYKSYNVNGRGYTHRRGDSRNGKLFSGYNNNQHRNSNALENGGENGDSAYSKYRVDIKDEERQRFGGRYGG